MKKPYWEVDEQGGIIEHYQMTDEEVEKAEDEGRIFVGYEWVNGLFSPKADFEMKTWVEGATEEEIQEVLNPSIPKEPSELDKLKEENARLKEDLEAVKQESQMNALAIFDLAEMLL